jgi:hypothetical protein
MMSVVVILGVYLLNIHINDSIILRRGYLWREIRVRGVIYYRLRWYVEIIILLFENYLFLVFVMVAMMRIFYYDDIFAVFLYDWISKGVHSRIYNIDNYSI